MALLGNNGLYTLGAGVASSVIADPFSTSKSYLKGDMVMNNGYLYSALSDIDSGEWDETRWLKTNVTTASSTSVYNSITAQSYKWENITSKLGTFNAEYGVISFAMNRFLGLMIVSGYAGWSSTSSSDRNMFAFKQVSEIAAFGGDITARYYNNSGTGSSSEIISIRPHGNNSPWLWGVWLRPQSTGNWCDGIYSVITLTSDDVKRQTFFDYIDAS